jgi:anti-sigma factor RsiW
MSDRDMHSDFDAPGRIQDYLDGVLSPEDERTFEAYMSTSPVLREQVASWRGLMGQLDALPRLAPSPQFRERVVAQLPPTPALERLRAAFRGGAEASFHRPGPTAPFHPPSERLQDFVEGVLPTATAARVRVHLQGCDPCRTEVEEWRTLFASLGTLPGLHPGPSFADRVMGAIPSGGTEGSLLAPSAAPSPSRAGFPDRLAARIRVLVPGIGRIRALAGAAVAAPAALAALALWFVASHPLLTPGHLLSFVLWRAGDAVGAVTAWMGSMVVESGATLRLMELAGILAGAPALTVLGVVGFCVAMVGSVWVLHRFLVASPLEGPNVHVPG